MDDAGHRAEKRRHIRNAIAWRDARSQTSRGGHGGSSRLVSHVQVMDDIDATFGRDADAN
jgi:hypothetical protein